MSGGHGRLVMAVMALVMASLACSVEWEGVTPSPLSMTSTPAPTPSMTATIQPDQCLLVHSLPGGKGNLNLRAGAGTQYPVLAVLSDGQTLTETGRAGDWYAVIAVMDNVRISGYVRADYVEVCK